IYAVRLKHISAQPADCDKPIKDWYHAFQLIRYLPPDYAGIVQAIYKWRDDDFKADKVLSELLAEEARLKQSNKDQEVLACQVKINSSRPLKVKAQKIPGENHDQVESTTTSSPPGTWIFDTAATSHFSCDKDSMLNYRPVKGAEVSVAIGGVTCPVEGTGEVELEFYKNVKHLKIFGAAAFLGVPEQQRRKLDMRAKKGIIVGYAQRTRGYRIWLPSDRKIIESINVNFDEDAGDRSGTVLDPPKTVSLKCDSPASNTDSDQESNKSYSDSDDSSERSEFKMETTSGTSKSGESQSVSPVKFSLVITAVPRKKGSRTDIYYYVSGSKTRLRSHEDVRKFCESNNLPYDGKLFDFSGKNTSTEKIKLEPTEVNISQTNVSKV
ncbi:hypothetical protein AVEN_162604-1, partial [Araneus ventricosus]